ncbi:MAG: ABC transporter ATP-binding protein [Gammaproteobacteria bacterium]|nr:ABC transporter ATP-binding protein [Gammaproteobacteria bacterium]MBQ0840456.1 ABC transporter ATP-binding protein [Gammaproteobacteria bacterium]
MNSDLPALHIKGLTKAYDNGFQALKGVDLDVMPGDFFALLGPNGAGKSTIIGIISSLVRKTSGLVSVFGHDIDRDFPRAKKDVGVVPQEFNFNQFEKVFDIVVTQAGYYGLPRKLAEQRAEKYLRRLGLWDKQDQRSRMLSGGMKRRLMIARALVHEPRLLILDEPTAGVDIELRRSLWDFLREINEQGTTIILTTHYLEEAESLCRRIAIIDQGLITQDTTTRELLAQLDKEVFVIDTREALESCPQLDGYGTQLIDSHSFEVVVEKGQSLNDLFAPLTARGIHVSSLRNKANRLEELFLSLVNGGSPSADSPPTTSGLKEGGP